MHHLSNQIRPFFFAVNTVCVGQYVELHSVCALTVVGNMNRSKRLGIICNKNPKLGLVEVMLNGVDVALDEYERQLITFKAIMGTPSNSSAFIIGGGGTGGGGSASTTVIATLVKPNDGIVGVLNNDKTNDPKIELEDTFPGSSFEDKPTRTPSGYPGLGLVRWSCKCPYCPERPPVPSPKAPTCYTCGDKMSPS